MGRANAQPEKPQFCLRSHCFYRKSFANKYHVRYCCRWGSNGLGLTIAEVLLVHGEHNVIRFESKGDKEVI